MEPWWWLAVALPTLDEARRADPWELCDIRLSLRATPSLRLIFTLVRKTGGMGVVAWCPWAWNVPCVASYAVCGRDAADRGESGGSGGSGGKTSCVGPGEEGVTGVTVAVADAAAGCDSVFAGISIFIVLIVSIADLAKLLEAACSCVYLSDSNVSSSV